MEIFDVGKGLKELFKIKKKKGLKVHIILPSSSGPNNGHHCMDWGFSFPPRSIFACKTDLGNKVMCKLSGCIYRKLGSAVYL